MPIFVYLDQKDFGALLEPANAPLRAELKGWTEIGDVVIPVSLIHVIETSKAKPALRTWLFELIAGVDLDALPLHVITAPTVRLDLARDQKKLRRTVEQLRPRLLVLDPFVRLHRVDENAAADVAPLLAYLRPLERELSTAVLLVHHARKGAAHARAGQALRGSSELHAWGDSNLYLRRRGEALLMTVEHRAAAPIQALALELRAEAEALVSSRYRARRRSCATEPSVSNPVRPATPKPMPDTDTGAAPTARAPQRAAPIPTPFSAVSSRLSPERQSLPRKRQARPGATPRHPFDSYHSDELFYSVC